MEVRQAECLGRTRHVEQEGMRGDDEEEVDRVRARDHRVRSGPGRV
jgi:hypothetical protein